MQFKYFNHFRNNLNICYVLSNISNIHKHFWRMYLFFMKLHDESLVPRNSLRKTLIFVDIVISISMMAFVLTSDFVFYKISFNILYRSIY